MLQKYISTVMVRFQLLFVLAVLVALVGCVETEKAAAIIAHFRQEFVEDTREEVFEVGFSQKQGNHIVLQGEMEDVHLKKRLVDSLEMNGFSVNDSITILPHDVPAPWGLVRLSVANLRAAPSYRAEMVTQAVMGTPVRILKEKGGWVYVQTPDQYLSWCGKSALALKTEAELSAWKESRRVVFDAPVGFVKEFDTARNVSDIVSGSVLKLDAEQGDQLRVRLPDGRTGRIAKSDTRLFNEKQVLQTVNPALLEQEARALMGVPYLWGGTSSKGVDCSGFTKTVYRQNGLILARDASLQARHGELVPADGGWQHFEKGDLLFFAPRRGSDRITHTGIYLADGEFIHSAGRVKVNSLDSTRQHYSRYRAETLVRVRRIRGNEGARGIVPFVAHPWYN